MKPCRFNHGDADVHVLTPEGCICFPNDREQWLCAQHFIKLVQQGAPYTLLEGPSYRRNHGRPLKIGAENRSLL